MTVTCRTRASFIGTCMGLTLELFVRDRKRFFLDHQGSKHNFQWYILNFIVKFFMQASYKILSLVKFLKALFSLLIIDFPLDWITQNIICFSQIFMCLLILGFPLMILEEYDQFQKPFITFSLITLILIEFSNNDIFLLNASVISAVEAFNGTSRKW